MVVVECTLSVIIIIFLADIINPQIKIFFNNFTLQFLCGKTTAIDRQKSPNHYIFFLVNYTILQYDDDNICVVRLFVWVYYFSDFSHIQLWKFICPKLSTPPAPSHHHPYNKLSTQFLNNIFMLHFLIWN